VHLTNTHLSQDVFRNGAGTKEFGGMNETELRDYQMWILPELQEYLLEIGKINDTNWLDNHLRKQFQKAMIHVVRMSHKALLKHSGVFELFGMDFMLDDNLNIWFIECNAGPQMVPTGDVKIRLLSTVLTELFEIQFAYLRSRMKRVHTFMKRFHLQTMGTQEIDWNYWQGEFNKTNQNQLETEYAINSTNGFKLIMDKTRPANEAYFDLLEPECIDDDF